MSDSDPVDAPAYLRRIGVDPASVDGPDLESLGRLQRAHVASVPFENLAIVGDPYGDWTGPGVALSTPALFEKIVTRRRGGFCFELNGLFHSLLATLGYDVDRIAARMVGDDGSATPPANHHSNVVELDERYVVDVGMGIPTLRRPLPMSGEPVADELGIEWRVADADRPDETHCTRFRNPGDDEWTTRYVFSDVPRELHYFEATCDYLQSAPESPFTGDAFATLATADGHLKLRRDELIEYVGREESRTTVSGADWQAVLREEFDLDYGDVMGR